jgi:DNA-binding PadR family transcriptional regulator
MERKLLLLGMLRVQKMYGYQLNEFIDAHLGVSVQLKKPTAYNLLNKMTDDGWISYREEQEGNRPPRRVYAITPQGEAAFQQLLRQSLADYKPAEFRSDIGMAFLDTIPVDEALPLLHKRRSIIESLAQRVHNHGDKHTGSFRFLIMHQKRHLAAELAWLDEVVDQIGDQL